MIRINESIGEAVFEIDNPDAPLYRTMIDDPEYYEEVKGMQYNIEFMTAREYIENTARIHRSNYYEELSVISQEKVQEYADLMKNGTVFPIPWLDFVDNYQEGRHRALAFKKAFGDLEKFPVFVVTAV